jgi:hypothetical protein
MEHRTVTESNESVENLMPGLDFIPNKFFLARGRREVAPFDSSPRGVRPTERCKIPNVLACRDETSAPFEESAQRPEHDITARVCLT